MTFGVLGLGDPMSGASLTVTMSAIFICTAAAAYLGYRPMRAVILRQEMQYDAIVRRALLLDVSPRVITFLAAAAIVVLGAIGYLLSDSLLGFFAGAAAGAFVPTLVLRWLRKRRLDRLEDQLVAGIQTLASGVRAGLNLVQSMELVARDGPVPLKQEFAHMLREYEYGVPLEEAMTNTAERVGSGDLRLLLAALQTHRERGGDLGETLDRIAESIREIQRLEHRVRTLTAQGRASSRFLALLVVIVFLVLYTIDPNNVRRLFVEDAGKLILLAIIALMTIGFLWIRKIVSIDI